MQGRATALEEDLTDHRPVITSMRLRHYSLQQARQEQVQGVAVEGRKGTQEVCRRDDNSTLFEKTSMAFTMQTRTVPFFTEAKTATYITSKKQR